jgi:hypothetical protein
MPESDEPPFPSKGLKEIYQWVSKAQQKLLVSGLLDIELEIDEKGQAQTVKVYKSPDEKMTQAIAGILMAQSFKPALCQGVPCKMSYPFMIDFKLVR